MSGNVKSPPRVVDMWVGGSLIRRPKVPIAVSWSRELSESACKDNNSCEREPNSQVEHGESPNNTIDNFENVAMLMFLSAW